MEFAVQRFFQRVIAGVATLVVTVVALVATPTTSAQASTACSTSGATSLYGGGSGTSADPHLISTPEQLAHLSVTSGDWGEHFRQTANIDLGGCAWSSIGLNDSTPAPFTGSYDGAGYRVSGLSIGDQPGDSAGFFGYAFRASISNLRLSGVVTANEQNVGGLAGNIQGNFLGPATISKVRVEMDISYPNSNFAGGIFGYGDSLEVSYSSYRGNFVANAGDTAGIAGWVPGYLYVTIQDSYARATFSGTSTRQSGITGWGDGAQVTRTYSASSGGDFGVAAAFSSGRSTGVFWDTTIGPATAVGSGSGSGATGLSTADMKTLSSYSQASWGIVDGWEPFNTSTNKIWGICSRVNDGYPFLLWEYASNPCVDPSSSDAGSAEGRGLSPAIHLDLKAKVGDQISGRPVEIAGTGVGGGSAYSLVVRSTPTTITSGSASGMGNFSNTLRMPALPAGTHTLTLTAIAPDGSALTLTQTFTVSAAGVVTSMSDPIGKVGKTLAETGSDPQLAMWGWGVALLLIAAGVLMRATRKRFAL